MIARTAGQRCTVKTTVPRLEEVGRSGAVVGSACKGIQHRLGAIKGDSEDDAVVARAARAGHTIEISVACLYEVDIGRGTVRASASERIQHGFDTTWSNLENGSPAVHTSHVGHTVEIRISRLDQAGGSVEQEGVRLLIS